MRLLYIVGWVMLAVPFVVIGNVGDTGAILLCFAAVLASNYIGQAIVIHSPERTPPQ